MDQSGPRHTSLKSPLIDRADGQSPRQRTLYGALTLAFWVFWFYLWLPVLALLAWALGVQQAYKYMVVLEGYQQVIRIMGLYSLIILLLGGALVLWASYSIFRFRGVERRSAGREITAAEIGQHFAQNTESVALWQGMQRLYVMHDQEGGIARVEAPIDGAALTQCLDRDDPACVVPGCPARQHTPAVCPDAQRSMHGCGTNGRS